MENQLSEAQTNLIECLKYLKIKAEVITGIMLMVQTDEQIAQMAEFMLFKPRATEQELLQKAVEIHNR